MSEERIAEGIARLGEALRALPVEDTQREPVPAA
jgi:hypothetical protein